MASPRTSNPGVETQPITALDKTITPGAGRRHKLAPMPMLPMSEAEVTLFQGFIQEYLDLYPDLTPVDYRLLYLAATEYIKYLRVTRAELDTGTVINMARQHPGVNMRALLDQLSVTRRSRTKPGAPQEPDGDAAELKELLLGLSGQRRK